VTSTSPTEIVARVRGADQKFSVLDVRRVTFADEPRELSAARDAVHNEQWDGARDQLKRIDAAALSRDLVKQDVEFFLAYALGRQALTAGGDKDAAAQAMMAFARGAPRSFHFVQAAEVLAELAVAREKYDEAARYYAYLTKAAQEASWSEYELRIGVLEARALTAKGSFAEAAARCDAVLAAGSDSPEAIQQKHFARVAKAVALAEQGKPAEGVQLLEELIQKNDAEATELFGRAYNALGHCYVKLNKPREALLAYLHTDLLFPQHPEVHAEALYNLGKLWTTANRSDRAVAARGILSERYAGSVWAKRN